MNDPHVHHIGQITDMDGKPLAIGADRNTIILGPSRYTEPLWQLTREMAEEVLRAWSEADRKAGAWEAAHPEALPAAAEIGHQGEAMTPAEELRRTAKLMRERARTATGGPWAVSEKHGRDIADEGWSDVCVTGPSGPVAITYLSSVLEGDPNEDNGAYIASMHPLVGLAVADWLDTTAGFLEDRVTIWGALRALAVARAFLGASPEQAAGEGQ